LCLVVVDFVPSDLVVVDFVPSGQSRRHRLPHHTYLENKNVRGEGKDALARLKREASPNRPFTTYLLFKHAGSFIES
jgi:hypothetical protein